ncbi:MAG: response regulator transcription factor [Elusimicrobia bacterium]|nr:response regulator transcription factor [Elusimicrobiota bacterium]
MDARPGGKVIQVCDDDAGVRGILVRLLSPYFTVVEASDGREALERIEARCPDLVLLDLVMPGLSGLETLEEYCKTHPGLATLVLTGEHAPEAACRALALGAHAYITKPFDAADLLDEVRGMLEAGDAGAGGVERPPWRVK